jgi:hypothetical protein
MRLQLSLGSDTPQARKKGGLVAPVLKLSLVGGLALLYVNRSDIRRYLRLRRM